MYEAVLGGAPQAEIYVVGYPQVLATKKKSDWPDARCIYLDWSLTWGDAIGARKVVELLDTTMHQQIDRANTRWTKAHPKDHARLHYVDPLADGSPFAGHSVCSAPGASHFNNVDTVLRGGKAFAFHPNDRWQRAYITRGPRDRQALARRRSGSDPLTAGMACDRAGEGSTLLSALHDAQ